MKITLFWDFFFRGFPTHFTTIISKTTTLSSKKNLTKGIQSLLNLILQGAKRALFFTNSLRQDPMVGTQEKEIQFNLCNLQLEWYFWSVLL